MHNTSAKMLGWAALCLLAGGCSIEGTRQRGDECLQDRECVSPLRCEVTTNGTSRCVTPTRLDAGPPVDVVAVTPDAGAPPVDMPAAPDIPAAPDVPPVVDMPPPPVDVPPVVDVPASVDSGVVDAAFADDGAG